MNNNPTNKKLLPKLRFPEFEGDGEWEENLLEDLSEFLKGKGISKADINNSGTLFCIRYGELYTLYNEVIGSVYSKTNLNPDNLVLSRKNDVLIPSSGETKEDIATASCVLKDNVALGGDINVLRSNLNGIFLTYFLNGAKKNEISKLAQGISVIHLYISQLKKLKIQIPDLKEQQKIANCLSSLDETIEAANEKLNLLKEHKKGLLQQLFPAAGEKVPKLRFPEFINDGDWEEKELGMALKAESSTIAKNKLILLANGFSVYGADGKIGCIDTYEQETEYIAIVKDGSGVGKLFFYECKSSVLGTLTYLLSKDVELFNLKWLYYLLLTVNFSPFVKGSGIPHIYYKDYSKLLIQIPKPKEQQKIANSLTSIDNKIEAQSNKIEVIKLHKKGLMQQLFPTLNEEA